MGKKFAIVKFPNENDARGIVPMCWVDDSESFCFYPTVTTNEMRDSLIKSEQPPADDWPRHALVILKKYGNLHFIT